MFYQLILSVAVAGLVINLIALFIIGKKKHRTMFHDLLIILTFSDVAVVICCALQFALPSLWRGGFCRSERIADAQSCHVL